MCGIAGTIGLGGHVAHKDAHSVRRMLDAERHRGPDAEGLYSDERVVLGHRRLSIIDLSPEGRQPMTNEDRNRWAVFNGEIYNYKELTAQLRCAGHVFRSSTDTEVLIHGYEQWGIEGLLGRLLGMFAFALYDASKPDDWRLFLARDRLGIKPLYYYASQDRIIFASEVGAILKSGLTPKEADRTALAGFLAQGSVPAPRTYVRDIRCLPPGQFLTVQARSSHPVRYWAVDEAPEKSVSPGELLADSVQRHLVADVPVGIFLSGGMDSAGIASLARRKHEGPVVTLTVTFDETEFNEGHTARRISESLGTNHHEIHITESGFFEHLPRFFASLDQPTSDGVNTYLVSLAARQLGLKVVLSGLGGDEVYFGYRHYRALARHAGLVTTCQKGSLAVRRILAGAMTAYGRLLGEERWRRFGFWSWCPPPLALYLTFRGFFPEREIGDLLGIDEKTVRETLLSALSTEEPEAAAPPAHVFNLMEIKRYLHDQLLRDSDVFSMAHSIELRVPYLDHRLVQALTSTAPEDKIHPRLNKPRLLDSVDGDETLQGLATAPKMGFTFPLARWLKRRSEEMEHLSLKGSHFDPTVVRRIWANFRRGRVHWSRAWALGVTGAIAARGEA